MLAFTKEQLEARVASILGGTDLLATVRRGTTGLLFVEVSLPTGYCLVDQDLYNQSVDAQGRKVLDIASSGPARVVGCFEPNYYQKMLVVFHPWKPLGFDGYVFEFNPWISDPGCEDDPRYPLDEGMAQVEALVDLFRSPF